MEREWVAEESVVVRAEPRAVYAAVADPRRMPGWSPELFAVWIRAKGRKFVGFNRIGWRVWFTDSHVTVAEPGRNYAFRVTSFGIPVALWGFRIEDIGDGSVRLAQYWEDLRRDHRGSGFVSVLGRLFTGVDAPDRAAHNRAGMRATLARIKTAVERAA
ncbi:Polyketide cyclase / dehydrase and lipid transport [Actinomadura rubteroloni]|uniref:Polyketide cyclase / dehydrase and lipid transport n=1 Tax=Actinomadura rubteroloni TaxID=1926885 RepID=A0A2P4UPG3_9ACTN|nr:SRPBCC family protein [Actinomadura rubteroloni]POM26937.1 Polyketide cyclase / dehydrase and lipid transport [Actinomadura rubteroloni]